MGESVPRAVSARYDRHGGRIVVELSRGLVGFLPERAQGFAKASPGEPARVESRTTVGKLGKAR
jgi:hypothetical protein